jgi:multiple sugar transport system permease protein
VTLGEVWRGTGLVSIILLAGLSRVSPSLLASSIADGATGWQRFRRVILPVMGPAFAVAATYRALDTFRILEGPLLTDRAGSSMRTAPLLIWRTTFSSFELGLGAAMSIILLVIAAVLGVVLVQLFRVRRVV